MERNKKKKRRRFSGKSTSNYLSRNEFELFLWSKIALLSCTSLNVVLYLGKDLIRTKGQILQEISGV